MTFKRVFGIVTDSVGIGEASDAKDFGDVGADTLGHIGDFYKGNFKVPNLQKMGLSNIRPENPIEGVPVAEAPTGYFGKMHEISVGKDSMDGHWEMMGLPVLEPLGFFPQGFPQELIDKLEKFSGRHIIVNKPYSGTDVIHDYGEHQMETGDLIVYTSGDSVLQIAAHEDVIPLEELYKICEYARSITIDKPYRIGRIIARPYVGPDKDHFTRTANRHDFALEPTDETDMDRLKAAGLDVLAVGKINDIFSGHGITDGVHTESNDDGMDKTIENAEKDFHGFSFTNLVDFDAMYGHRRNPEGYGKALMAFDVRLGELMSKLKDDDLLIITADHGNAPGFKGTDHTREYVPLLVWSPSFKGGKALGIRQTYGDFGATVLDNFNVQKGEYGTSFLADLQ
ncbi:phosphopentomutase [Secundilactobacillus paracollinoides]|uniref:Phosphopentomutase n=1 Tax=Secundilactobacillus paracollinoides TaxID=240427 RepID=A0A1B2IUV6_9LACO|nr:phosphopentomutase [Secundilactobacillus paracollinoides]ANZ65844.1 phosphopentomutase [Secundilactobacillus paracollinoides]